jgi:hypothetical protein
MKIYAVYDCERPAAADPSSVWGFYQWSTFEEAREYAVAWLGQWAEVIPNNWDGKSVDYSGCGDTIEIRCENWPPNFKR